MTEQRHLPYCPDGAHRLDLYRPSQPAGSLLLYFHGGGLEGGDKADLDRMPELLTESGITLASANYRMYPQARFPDYVDDCARAAAWAAQYAQGQKGLSRLYIGGSSAGAYLAMMLFLDARYLARYGLDPWDISGYLFDAGQPTTHFNVLRERGLDTRLVRVDEAAPIYHITQDFPAGRALPRLLLMAADSDMPNRLEQNRLLIGTLLHFGYPQDHISFMLMEHATHCQYTGGADFCRRVAAFAR